MNRVAQSEGSWSQSLRGTVKCRLSQQITGRGSSGKDKLGSKSM